MGVNSRVELEWQGVEYPVLVTMGVIERLEEKLNLARMASDCARNDLKMSHAARLVATMLKEGGAEVEVSDVFDYMFENKGKGGADIINFVSVILGQIFAEPKKKPEYSNKAPKVKA